MELCRWGAANRGSKVNDGVRLGSVHERLGAWNRGPCGLSTRAESGKGVQDTSFGAGAWGRFESPAGPVRRHGHWRPGQPHGTGTAAKERRPGGANWDAGSTGQIGKPQTPDSPKGSRSLILSLSGAKWPPERRVLGAFEVLGDLPQCLSLQALHDRLQAGDGARTPVAIDIMGKKCP